MATMENLKARARDLGADAVIKIEFGKSRMHYSRKYCRGLAIVYE